MINLQGIAGVAAGLSVAAWLLSFVFTTTFFLVRWDVEAIRQQAIEELVRAVSIDRTARTFVKMARVFENGPEAAERPSGTQR